MSLVALANRITGLVARTRLNAWMDQINTNTTDIAGKQAADADLTAIAAISPSNDDIIQRKAGAWTNRTVAQYKTDLTLVKADVGLGNVDNTSDATKNAAAVALTNKTSLNTHTIPGGTSTLVITTDLASYQAKNAASTLFDNVRLLTGTFTCGNTDGNTIQIVTNTGATGAVFQDQAGIPNFLIGQHVEIYNMAGSTNPITISAAGSGTLEYANGTNNQIAAGTSAHMMCISSIRWVRLH